MHKSQEGLGPALVADESILLVLPQEIPNYKGGIRELEGMRNDL
jgi:hypothetical protein